MPRLIIISSHNPPYVLNNVKADSIPLKICKIGAFLRDWDLEFHAYSRATGHRLHPTGKNIDRPGRIDDLAKPSESKISTFVKNNDQ
jgi:hypothetical protein